MAQELVAAKETDKSHLEADVARSISDFLRGYAPDEKPAERDVVDKRYRVDLNAPLPDFDCKSAKAYAAIDIKLPDKIAYVALVCASGALPRMDIISPLRNAPHPHIMNLVTAGVVALSRPQEERFVILYERPKGKKLSVLIAATKTRPSFEFICHNIITPLALAIQHLSDLGIAHGNINCENIYYGNSLMVGHCAAEPCGLSQPFYYEPLERMQAQPAGKGEGSVAQDYYALAVVIMQIIYGMNHFSGITEKALIKRIMKDGAFTALTRNKDMPEVFYDFFRGLLSPTAQDRWGFKYLKAWLDGKRYNVMPTPPQQEAIRPFEFEESHAYTRKEVANLLAQHWKDVPDIIESGQLSSWVVISLRNKELNEYLISTAKTMNEIGRKGDASFDEQIMRLISTFDPMSPVRLQKLSFHLDGIGSLFAEVMASNSPADLLLLSRFIEFSMFHFVIHQRKKDNEKYDEIVSSTIDTILPRLERLRSIIKNNGFGFGNERVLYELNPTMQCLSPLLAGKYVTTLPALLTALNELAPNLAASGDPIDKHIAAFIATHLKIQHEIYLTQLDAHPSLANNPAMIALKLLAAAQHRAKTPYLPALTHWLAMRILPSLEVIRSKTLKKKLLHMLENSAKSGSLQKMADIFIESGYADAEDRAFKQAINNFKRNAKNIIYYKRPEVLEEHSNRLGVNMAHYGAMAALAFSFYLAVRGS